MRRYRKHKWFISNRVFSRTCPIICAALTKKSESKDEHNIKVEYVGWKGKTLFANTCKLYAGTLHASLPTRLIGNYPTSYHTIVKGIPTAPLHWIQSGYWKQQFSETKHRQTSASQRTNSWNLKTRNVKGDSDLELSFALGKLKEWSVHFVKSFGWT